MVDPSQTAEAEDGGSRRVAADVEAASAVPEPSGAALLLSGLAAMGLLSHR